MKERYRLNTRLDYKRFTLMVAALALFCGISDAWSNEGTPPPVVTVTAVDIRDVNPPKEYVGRIEAIQSVDLRARVEGFLDNVRFKEGSFVKKNQLLYIIEQAPYQAKMNEAEAKVAQAEAALTKARQYLKRLQTVRSGGISKTDLETAEADELEAKAQLQEALANLDQAKLDMDYTTVEAPISGRIGRTTYTKGNLVGPSSEALARIVQLDPIRVVYSVSENDYVDVKTDPDLASAIQRQNLLIPRIKMPNGQILGNEGELDFADNEVDPATGTIAVRAVFDNPDNFLLPGQYVTVLLSHHQPRKLPVIPQAAVQEDRQGRYVFIVDSENRVQQRRITTGAVIDTFWAVESGLAGGEMVIVQGVQKVRPGQTVKTVKDRAATRG